MTDPTSETAEALPSPLEDIKSHYRSFASPDAAACTLFDDLMIVAEELTTRASTAETALAEAKRDAATSALAYVARETDLSARLGKVKAELAAVKGTTFTEAAIRLRSYRDEGAPQCGKDWANGITDACTLLDDLAKQLPTHPAVETYPRCPATQLRYRCSLTAGHAGNHLHRTESFARTGETIVWDGPPAVETPGATGLFIVQLICCGRHDGEHGPVTWEQAEAFRESYCSGPGVADPPQHDNPHMSGHKRSAIIVAAPPADSGSVARGLASVEAAANGWPNWKRDAASSEPGLAIPPVPVPEAVGAKCPECGGKGTAGALGLIENGLCPACHGTGKSQPSTASPKEPECTPNPCPTAPETSAKTSPPTTSASTAA